jgi:hypothetical protein
VINMCDLARWRIPRKFLLLIIAVLAIVAFVSMPSTFFAESAGESLSSRATIIKFREGAHVRLRDRRFVRLADDLTQQLPLRDQHSQPDAQRLASQISLINQIVAARPGLDVSRLFLLPEERLDHERQAGEQMSRHALADLNLYYQLTVSSGADVDWLLEELNALDIIEHAYLEPRIELAGRNSRLPRSPDFRSEQGYLNPAPQGIDAYYAWTLPGGRGEGVKIIDIETGWNLKHEDLPPTFYRAGLRLSALDARNHGTAVLGQLVGVDNGYGIIGIAHQARAGVVSWVGIGVAAAINLAAAKLDPGDVILIEVQAQGPVTGHTCECACQQFESAPVEYHPAEFDAIRQATARGIVVVEAAGNGSIDLDHPAYQGRFHRAVRDSGAILVGAGEPFTGLPLCWTNHGSRVDVHAWGESIVTAGYGDLNPSVRNEYQYYTRRFAGTSGASPIVAGAAAVIQGVRRAQGAPPLTPVELRDLLTETGTPQGESEKHIGPRPDLRKALDAGSGTEK